TYADTPACVSLHSAAAGLADFYGQVADEVGHPGREAPVLVPAPPAMPAAVPRQAVIRQGLTQQAGPGKSTAPAANGEHRPHPHLLWVQEHLHHLSESAAMVSEPALRVAEARRRPWWR